MIRPKVVGWVSVIILLVVAPLTFGRRPNRHGAQWKDNVDLQEHGHLPFGFENDFDDALGEIDIMGGRGGLSESAWRDEMFHGNGMPEDFVFLDFDGGLGEGGGARSPFEDHFGGGPFDRNQGDFGVGGGWDEKFSDMFYHADSFMELDVEEFRNPRTGVVTIPHVHDDETLTDATMPGHHGVQVDGHPHDQFIGAEEMWKEADKLAEEMLKSEGSAQSDRPVIIPLAPDQFEVQDGPSSQDADPMSGHYEKRARPSTSLGAGRFDGHANVQVEAATSQFDDGSYGPPTGDTPMGDPPAGSSEMGANSATTFGEDDPAGSEVEDNLFGPSSQTELGGGTDSSGDGVDGSGQQQHAWDDTAGHTNGVEPPGASFEDFQGPPDGDFAEDWDNVDDMTAGDVGQMPPGGGQETDDQFQHDNLESSPAEGNSGQGSTESQPPAACGSEADGALVCSGHGSCHMEMCVCDVGWTVEADCSTEDAVEELFFECDCECSPQGMCVNGTCECFDGWKGACCNEKQTDQDRGCALGCGEGDCINGTCFCHDGYDQEIEGGVCSVLKTCGSVVCNHGICDHTAETCVCEDGWSGEACHDLLCTELNGCSGHGDCFPPAPGRCACHSDAQGTWDGEMCDKHRVAIHCPEDCEFEEHGICNEDGGCDCNPGWTGRSCENPECVTSCGAPQRGECVVAAKSARCSCKNGFTGDACDREEFANGRGYILYPDDAASRFGGEGRAGATIVCNEGFKEAFPGDLSGGLDAHYDECTLDACPSAYGAECSGHGNCDSGVCNCSSGWTRRDCSWQLIDTPSAEKECTKACSHGFCDFNQTHQFCICDPGWTGEHCNERSCLDDCNSNGQCADGVCVCFSGYEGLSCDRKQCAEPRCSGHGECYNGECLCWPLWEGTTCSNKVCNPMCVEGHGTCSNGTCLCIDGWEGVACECPPGCDTSHGSCIDDDCVCQMDWGGPYCNASWCPGNCSGNANACGDETHGVCQCSPGFVGDQCELRDCGQISGTVCSGNGECHYETGECMCLEGYRGGDCRELLLASGHGQVDTVSLEVRCDEGYETFPLERHVSRMPNSTSSSFDELFNLLCNSMACPGDCTRDKGHGVCKDGICSCNGQWQGESCDQLGCPNGCSGRGMCDLSTATCQCDPGYSLTASMDCGVYVLGGVSQGIIEYEVVKCHPYYMGAACEDPTCPPFDKNRQEFPNDVNKWTVPEICSGRGYCSSTTEPGECSCNEAYPGMPWQGSGCEIDPRKPEVVENSTSPSPSPSKAPHALSSEEVDELENEADPNKPIAEELGIENSIEPGSEVVDDLQEPVQEENVTPDEDIEEQDDPDLEDAPAVMDEEPASEDEPLTIIASDTPLTLGPGEAEGEEEPPEEPPAEDGAEFEEKDMEAWDGMPKPEDGEGPPPEFGLNTGCFCEEHEGDCCSREKEQGDCSQQDDGTYKCVCVKPYQGKACEIKPGPDEVTVGGFTECPQNCSGHGTCDDGTCICDKGWGPDKEDTDCSVSSCPLACSGHGTCDTSTGKCDCVENWSGNGCQWGIEYAYRCPYNCYDNGRCHDPVTGLEVCGGRDHGCYCICNANYDNNTWCQYEICPGSPQPCTSHRKGKCIRGECACKPGWIENEKTGVNDCSTPMDSMNRWMMLQVSELMSPPGKTLSQFLHDPKGGQYYLVSGRTQSTIKDNGAEFPMDIWRLDGKRWVKIYGEGAAPIVSEDVARGKTATQSSTRGKAKAARAVDGNTDSRFEKGHCTSTLRDYEPWWSVDLKKTHAVKYVRITNRHSCSGIRCQERLKGLQVRVGDMKKGWRKAEKCNDFPLIPMGQHTDVQCMFKEGNAVWLVIPSTRSEISVCGVEVIGKLAKDKTETKEPWGRYGHQVVMWTNENRLFMFGGMAQTPFHPVHKDADGNEIPGRFVYMADLWYFDLARYQWYSIELQDTPKPRFRHTMNIDEDQAYLYVFGGSTFDPAEGKDPEYLSDLWIYDIRKRLWKQWEGCQKKQDTDLMGSLGGGGGGQGDATDGVTLLEVGQDGEGGGASDELCPSARHGHSSGWLDNQLYIFGGTDGTNYFNDLWVWDPRVYKNNITGAWIQVVEAGEDGPKGREGHVGTMDPSGTYVVLMGRGEDNELFGDVWQYNFDDNFWNDMVPTGNPYTRHEWKKVPSPRDRVSAVLWERKILVFGGWDADHNYHRQTWEYDFSPAYPPHIYKDCAEVVKLATKENPASSGYYWVGFHSGNSWNVYCDLETDGGGWMLVSTQVPDGLLHRMQSGRLLYDEDIGLYNQKLSQAALDAQARLYHTQVMVEENQWSRDAQAGLVMVYMIWRNVALRFDGRNARTRWMFWHTGDGEYKWVYNNARGNWWGLSAHGWSFWDVERHKRCTVKKDFKKTMGYNGDYKLDHRGWHSGTTRCLHGRVGIGVTHWVRTWDYIYLMKKNFCMWGKEKLYDLWTTSSERCWFACYWNYYCNALVFMPEKGLCSLRKGFSDEKPCPGKIWSYQKLKSEPNLDFDYARGKRAWQSSTGWHGHAHKAVDGISHPHYWHRGGHCTHTRYNWQPWWLLDLGETRQVAYVRLFNRGDCCGQRLANAEVRVGRYTWWPWNPPCGGRGWAAKRVGFACEPRYARYVQVVIRDRRDYLTLCGVEVYAEAKEEPMACESCDLFYKSAYIWYYPGWGGRVMNAVRRHHPRWYHRSCWNWNPYIMWHHHNRGMCWRGRYYLFGQQFTIRFVEKEGANWQFIYAIDGYFYVTLDGIGVDASAGYSRFHKNLGYVRKGEHELEVFVWEPCCDGSRGSWLFRRKGGPWTRVSRENLFAACAVGSAPTWDASRSFALTFTPGGEYHRLWRWYWPLRVLGGSQQSFEMQFDVMIYGWVWHWSNLFHLGHRNVPRSPAFWLYPRGTRLHFRLSNQRWWNDGCDSPRNLHYGAHTVRVMADNSRRLMETYIDNELVCRRRFYANIHIERWAPFWHSSPWYWSPHAWVRNVIYGPIGAVAKAESTIKRRIDLACGKPTRQISSGWWGWSWRAVQGVHSPYYGHWRCTHTHYHWNPWWRVDLQDSQALVQEVTVLNRYHCAWRLQRFEVRVGNSHHWWRNPRCGALNWPTSKKGHGNYYTVDCGEKPLKGRYVFIIVRRRDYLTLCGVQVFGPSLEDKKMKDIDIRDRRHVDGAANIQFIDTTMVFTKDGQVIGWSFYVKRPGTHYMEVWRKSGVNYGCSRPNEYMLVAMHRVDSPRRGFQRYNLASNQYMNVKKGDVIGWRHQGRGVISFDYGSRLPLVLYQYGPGPASCKPYGPSWMLVGQKCYSRARPTRWYVGREYRCAGENQNCQCSGYVYYGPHYRRDIGSMRRGPYRAMHVWGGVRCGNGQFGDPIRGTYKHCICQPHRNWCIYDDCNAVYDQCRREGGRVANYWEHHRWMRAGGRRVRTYGVTSTFWTRHRYQEYKFLGRGRGINSRGQWAPMCRAWLRNWGYCQNLCRSMGGNCKGWAGVWGWCFLYGKRQHMPHRHTFRHHWYCHDQGNHNDLYATSRHWWWWTFRRRDRPWRWHYLTRHRGNYGWHPNCCCQHNNRYFVCVKSAASAVGASLRFYGKTNRQYSIEPHCKDGEC